MLGWQGSLGRSKKKASDEVWQAVVCGQVSGRRLSGTRHHGGAAEGKRDTRRGAIAAGACGVTSFLFVFVAENWTSTTHWKSIPRQAGARPCMSAATRDGLF